MYWCTFIFVGIDPRLWKQAQLDNPDPERYIPVPMIGFGEVRWRMKCQEQEIKLHQAFLDRVAEDIAELQRRHTATVAKIAEYRHKFLELEHRVLQVSATFLSYFLCQALFNNKYMSNCDLGICNFGTDIVHFDESMC